MPWIVRKGQGGCGGAKPWAVLNEQTHDLVACHSTKAKALAQTRALYASEPAAATAASANGSQFQLVDPDLQQAKDFLDAAITIHQGHMDGSIADTPETRKAEMDLLEKARAALETEQGDGMSTVSPSTLVADKGGSMTTTFATSPNTTTSNGNVVITINGGDDDQEFDSGPAAWEGVIGVEGLATDDGRYLMPGKITERDLPLTLMAQFVNMDGHEGSQPAGKITEIWRQPNTTLGPNAVEIWGRGEFDTGDVGMEAARLVENQVLRGVSLDLAPSAAHALDPVTEEPIDENSVDMMQVLMGNYITGIEGTIMGCTLVPFPAFSEASLRVIPNDQVVSVVSCAYPMKVQRQALTAASVAPLRPPRAWFETPEPDHLVPLTVTDEGQVYGHMAPWNQCHAAFPDSCELAPKSKSGYSLFHLGSLLTAEGDTIPVGRLTVGKGSATGGHYWDLIGGSKGAIEHYDRTGAVAAFVRAKDGKHGIWLAGTVKSDATPEQIRDLRANPPSGDWRWENGGYELVAALSVPVPGYPVIMASATGEQRSLMIPGYAGKEGEGFMATRSEQRKLALMADKGREALAAGTELAAGKTCLKCGTQNLSSARVCMACGKKFAAETETLQSMMPCPSCGSMIPGDAPVCPECGADQGQMGSWADEFDYNAEQRRAMAKSGEALPDGSFPIANCADAEKAIHAQGRANDQAAAVAHIKKRVSALGCTGKIFDNYK